MFFKMTSAPHQKNRSTREVETGALPNKPTNQAKRARDRRQGERQERKKLPCDWRLSLELTFCAAPLHPPTEERTRAHQSLPQPRFLASTVKLATS